ncbi:hypothetical protein VP01_3605g1 [Puccinia sorghi]|uniref:Uncharacterized protein n=1 Tax=Puccinia sorghi TaxID=27349 RepID=A0A0L6UV14_9BASI|nr:hypothetical protein VP01_3605g1 [Puccinia sorghi]
MIQDTTLSPAQVPSEKEHNSSSHKEQNSRSDEEHNCISEKVMMSVLLYILKMLLTPLKPIKKNWPSHPKINLPEIYKNNGLSNNVMNLKEKKILLQMETGVDVTFQTVKKLLGKAPFEDTPNQSPLPLSISSFNWPLYSITIQDKLSMMSSNKLNQNGWLKFFGRHMKCSGIKIYGFIDAWSCKLLGLFVHVTNNNPQYIAVYFLHLASKAAQKCMHFTNSTQNEKIEALWSQMMKQHNQSIKHDNMDQIENGFYNPTDHVQKLFFLYLWIPEFQASFTPKFMSSTPKYFETTYQLFQVPSADIDTLSKQIYPDTQNMFVHTPPDFHHVASTVMEKLGLSFSDIDEFLIKI